MTLDNLEVVTLFVNDIVSAKDFYKRVFSAQMIFEDEVSALFRLSGAMINLLADEQAPELVEPLTVGSPTSGVRMLLTIRVNDVDATCRELVAAGVRLLNGPMNRPWGRRTAAFADPSGHVWEIAHELA